MMARVDIVILLPTPPEFDDFFEELRGQDRSKLVLGDCPAFTHEIVAKDGTTIRLLAVGCHEKGQEPARQTVYQILKDYEFGYIVVLGTAGRLDGRLSLGDVVVPSEVQSILENSRLEEESISPHQRNIPLDRDFATIARTFHKHHGEPWAKLREQAAHERKQIEDLFGTSLAPEKNLFPEKFRITFGPILSEDQTFSDSWVVEQALSHSRELQAVETEARGASRALNDRNSKAKLAVIRGLSDPAQDKARIDLVTRGAIRSLAVRNAARVFCACVETGPLTGLQDNSVLSPNINSGALPAIPGNSDPRSVLAATVRELQNLEDIKGASSSEGRQMISAVQLSPPELEAVGVMSENIFRDKDEVVRHAEFITRDKLVMNSTYNWAVQQVAGHSGGSMLSPAQVALVYKIIGIVVPPTSFVRFTERSFEAADWQRLIRHPQEPGTPANHLHFSNDMIASEIFADLANRRREIAPGAATFPIRILEAGSGGCNTTLTMFAQLFHAQRAIDPQLKFQYLGLEINNSFALQGNDLFRGTDWHRVNGADLRTTLSNPLLSRWPGEQKFIWTGDAPVKIAELSIDPIIQGTMDYFVTSYMFHHVPNGERLLDYLFGQRSGAHNILGDARKEPDYFVERLYHFWDRQGAFNPNATDIAANSLVQYFRLARNMRNGNEFEIVAKDIAKYLSLMNHSARGDGLRAPLPEAVHEFFYDPQRQMLRNIHRLLRPGGLVVIADPDGMSNFNRSHIGQPDPIAVEMAIAHFRELSRLCEVLEEEHFNVERAGRVISVKGERRFDYVPERDFGRVSSDIIDPNLGYFVVARKN